MIRFGYNGAYSTMPQKYPRDNHVDDAPNGLALSRAAPIDRDDTGAEITFKIGPILLDAQRRRLQRRVGRRRSIWLSIAMEPNRHRRKLVDRQLHLVVVLLGKVAVMISGNRPDQMD